MSRQKNLSRRRLRMSAKYLSLIMVAILFSSVNSTTLELGPQQDPAKSLMNNSRYQDIMSNWDWSETLANDYGVSADDIATDSSGNIYIVGTMQGLSLIHISEPTRRS